MIQRADAEQHIVRGKEKISFSLENKEKTLCLVA